MNAPAVIQSMRFRWASTALEIDGAYGGSVSDCHFEFCQNGVWVTACQDAVQVSGTKCNVQTPFWYSCYGGISGSLTDLCNPDVDCPALTTECRQDRIVLHWTLPKWVEDGWASVSDFKIHRCSTPYGGCTPGSTVYQTVTNPVTRSFVDTSVTPGTVYCYSMSFHYQGNGCTTAQESGLSPAVCAQTCPLPVGNPIDAAFIVDNTSSTDNAILSQLTSGITTVLNEIQTASGNNYRLALVTPDDDAVNVRVSFGQNNRAAFETALNAVTPVSGGNACESTDECLNTAVNALSAAGRTMSYTCTPAKSPQQTGDFSAFRMGTGVRRLVVLITDAPPSGFCDKGPPWGAPYDAAVDGQRALNFAQTARGLCIRINAIQPATIDGVDAAAQSLMNNYSQTTCGWYSQLPHNATGLTEAIVKMLYSDGACNCQ